MEEINVLIEMLEHAGINYDVDQTIDKDGHKSLDVYIYDNDGSAVFKFDNHTETCCEPGCLVDFKINK